MTPGALSRHPAGPVFPAVAGCARPIVRRRASVTPAVREAVLTK
jgi:hypothetical protein